MRDFRRQEAHQRARAYDPRVHAGYGRPDARRAAYQFPGRTGRIAGDDPERQADLIRAHMIPHLSERALVLAPLGRDAEVASAMLSEAGILSVVCRSLPELVEQLVWGAGFALVTEEALHTADLHPLAAWIGAQPDWSDFPFVLLTRREGGIERNPAAMRLL